MEKGGNQSPREALRRRGDALVPGDGVSSPDELRSYAVDCARLAQNATDPRDKARLLTMARSWSDLANRIEQIGHVRRAIPPPGEDNATSHPQGPPEPGARLTFHRESIRAPARGAYALKCFDSFRPCAW